MTICTSVSGRRRVPVGMMRIALALALLVGCSAAGVDAPDLYVGLEDAEPVLTFSPTPEAADATEEAVQAWREATGLEIAIAPGGIEVGIVAETTMLEAHCAATGRIGGVISVEVMRAPPVNKCRDWAGTLRHELGHAISRYYAAGSIGENHTEHGLMASKANSQRLIDEGALELVCGWAPCAWMQVEQ